MSNFCKHKLSNFIFIISSDQILITMKALIKCIHIHTHLSTEVISALIIIC